MASFDGFGLVDGSEEEPGAAPKENGFVTVPENAGAGDEAGAAVVAAVGVFGFAEAPNWNPPGAIALSDLEVVCEFSFAGAPN